MASISKAGEVAFENEPCPKCGEKKLRRFKGYCWLMEGDGLPHFCCYNCRSLVCTPNGPKPSEYLCA